MPTLCESFSQTMFEKYNKTPNAKNLMNSLKETKELCSSNKILLAGYYIFYGLVVFLICGFVSFLLKVWRYEHSRKFYALVLFFAGILLISYKLQIIF